MKHRWSFLFLSFFFFLSFLSASKNAPKKEGSARRLDNGRYQQFIDDPIDFYSLRVIFARRLGVCMATGLGHGRVSVVFRCQVPTFRRGKQEEQSIKKKQGGERGNI